MSATISRDYTGYQLHNASVVDKDTQETVIYAVGSYGHLVAHNEQIALDTWVARIMGNYANSARLLAICKAIKALNAKR